MRWPTFRDAAAAFFIWMCLILMWPGSYLMQACGQCYGCGSFPTPTATATATGVATATATATASPTATATSTPMACATITPPALRNPQIFVNGANFGGHIVSNDGVTDNSLAMNAALAAGDVSVSAGTYWINWNKVTITSQHIQCPTPVGGFPTAYFKNTTRPGNSDMFTFNPAGGGTNPSIFYCGFWGPFYNQHQNVCDNWESSFLRIWNGSNVQIVGNDFNGISGWLGAIYTGPVNGSNISCNTFEDCGYYAIQTGGGTNQVISHNTMNDCSGVNECDDGGGTLCSGIVDSNHFTFTHGVNDVNCTTGPFNGLTTGDNPAGWDYSGWTISNNIVDGTCTSFLEPGGSSGTKPPTLINNQCNGSCQTSSYTAARKFCP